MRRDQLVVYIYQVISKRVSKRVCFWGVKSAKGRLKSVFEVEFLEQLLRCTFKLAFIG